MTLPPKNARYLMPLLAAALGLSMVASLMLGPVSLSGHQIWQTLIGQGDLVSHTILLELRLPRMILGALVGGMLGLSGAVMQGYLRNPLAEPSVLGTSNAAALGASIALYFGLATLHPAALPLVAILFSLSSLGLLFVLAGKTETPLTLILAGIAVSTLAGAGISLALNVSPNPFAAMEIMTWLMGSLENRSINHIWIALPCILLGGLVIMRTGKSLDALSLGEEAAISMGTNLRVTKWQILLGTGVGVGGAVAVSGAIGFIGLIVPHLIRPFTDRTPSATLAPSILGGALLLTLADLAVRILPTTNELKLGVITAFLGVPIFVVHLLRTRQSW